MSYLRIFLLFSIGWLGGCLGSAFSQDTAKIDSLSMGAFYDMSLDQLDSVKASGVSSELEKFINSLMAVATGKSVSTRSIPSVVSLITKEQIQNQGARDLIEVLRLVPGFHFGLGVDGRVGLGVRGNWAHEGKVLMLIDGVEMNESYQAQLYFGNHFPVNNIERIEIIRGPGSAVYGGFAEYAVINIITTSAEMDESFKFGGTYSQLGGIFSRRTTHAYVGRKYKTWQFNVSTFVGVGQRSNRDHFAMYPDSLIDKLGVGKYESLSGESDIQPFLLNAAVSWKNFDYRSITDLYEITNIALLDSNNNRSTQFGFQASYHDLRYQWQIRDNFKLTPRIYVLNQFPELRLSNEETSDNTINRSQYSVTGDWDLNHRINIIGGAQLRFDFAEESSEGPFIVPFNIQYENISIFAQSIIKKPWANLTFGARYEYNTEYGENFVPRVALTRQFGDFHIKLMSSNAFRAPSIGNVALSSDGQYEFNSDSTGLEFTNVGTGLSSEEALVFEAEFGYQLGSRMFFTLNLFDINSTNPIVYSYFQDTTMTRVLGPISGDNQYQNFSRSGSTGIEFDYRFQDRWGYLSFNYSFYTTNFKPVLKDYAVAEFQPVRSLREVKLDNQVLAFPSHKFNVNLTFYLKNWSANLTSTLYGTRYGYDVLQLGDALDEDGNVIIPAKFNVSGQLKRYDPSLLTNLFFRRKDIITKDLNIGFGVSNIFNSRYQYIQPFFGLNAPLPGPGREFTLKIDYRIPIRPYSKKKRAATE